MYFILFPCVPLVLHDKSFKLNWRWCDFAEKKTSLDVESQLSSGSRFVTFWIELKSQSVSCGYFRYLDDPFGNRVKRKSFSTIVSDMGLVVEFFKTNFTPVLRFSKHSNSSGMRKTTGKRNYENEKKKTEIITTYLPRRRSSRGIRILNFAAEILYTFLKSRHYAR